MISRPLPCVGIICETQMTPDRFAFTGGPMPKKIGRANRRPLVVDRHVNKASLHEKFALIHEHWRPKVVAQLNGQELKLVKIAGVFPWHRHELEDELFLVWRGQMTIEFPDRQVTLQAGQFCVVPRGVEHRTMADAEAEVLVFEPAQTRNTGNVVDEIFT